MVEIDSSDMNPFSYLSLLLLFLSIPFLGLIPQGILEKDRSEVILELLTSDLESPVAFSSAKGTDDFYIAEQKGLIKIFSNGEIKKFPLIDLRKKVAGINRFYSEKGLLGIAFHPKYDENRKFYIFYSTDLDKSSVDHKMTLSEFQSSLANPDKALMQSEKVILEIEQPEANHNGGTIVFGNDGTLYIGSGDGGGAGDKHGKEGNGQNLNTLLGKLLRINIDTSETETYKIPADNPFLKKNALPEIYAYGLRNPWKFSFDRLTGKLLLGDVGQERIEEINIIEKGKNYGWKIMEGNLCYDPPEECTTKDLELPIYSYTHKEGVSVIGGYVYRGSKKSYYYGKYIFADWSGRIFVLSETNKVWNAQEIKIQNKETFRWKFINSFGEDNKGNLYILTQEKAAPGSKGYLYKLVL
jgi:glucose/arabinose dehydrogenase